jgi:hypothetical protein
MRPEIQAENGTVPKAERRLHKKTAREVALTLAKGWQAQADRLAADRLAYQQIVDNEHNPRIKKHLENVIAELKASEQTAWLYVLLFATTQTPRERNPFKRRAYHRFLADDVLSRHLVPARLDVHFAWSGDTEKELRKMLKKAFGIRKPKKKKATSIMEVGD